MATILIVYASDYGNTEKMAQAATEGVNSVADAQVLLRKAEEVTKEDFTASDGVLFGSPVHMGGVDWRLKKVIDTICSGLWMQDLMNGKVAGVFSSGGGFGGAGGGVELMFVSMLNNFAELGMLIVPLPKMTEDYQEGGLQWGPYGRSADEKMQHVGVTDAVLELSRRHAANVTRAAQILKGQKIFD